MCRNYFIEVQTSLTTQLSHDVVPRSLLLDSNDSGDGDGFFAVIHDVINSQDTYIMYIHTYIHTIYIFKYVHTRTHSCKVTSSKFIEEQERVLL